MNEEKQMVMVSSTGEDPSHKKPCFLKSIVPNSSIVELFKLPQGFTSLPPHFDPKHWPLKLGFRGWPLHHQDLKTWVAHLAPVHQSTWKKAGIYEAIFNSTYEIKKKKDLVCELAEKWCGETNTFVFPWGEATITLEDVMVLGGFPVLGDSIFSPLENRELREVEEKLEKERMGLYDYSAGFWTASTKLWMQKFMKSGSELEHEAFLVFWLSRYVFHGRNIHNNSVNKAVFYIAIRLARGIRIALAPAVLASIYKDLSMLKMTIVALNGFKDRKEIVDVTVMSPFHLVQVWAWERFVELRPVPNVVSSAEPRLARWDKVDFLNVRNMRMVLDNAGEGFIWRPYAMAAKNYVFPGYHVEIGKWVLVGPELDDEHGLLSFAMFLSVPELVGFGTKQKYLPHRVAMQFGFCQDLPCSSVAVHNHMFENCKWYIPPKASEADAKRYLNWCKESAPHDKHKCIPLKKKAKRSKDSKEANKISEATIACEYSPRSSEKAVQVSTRRNEDNDNNVPLGSPPTCNQVVAIDPMDEDTPVLSDVLINGKTEKNAETKESGECEKLSDQVQNLVSSCVEKVSGNSMRSEAIKKEVKTEVLDGSSEAKCNLLNAVDSNTGGPNSFMASTTGNEYASSSLPYETRVKRLYLLS